MVTIDIKQLQEKSIKAENKTTQPAHITQVEGLVDVSVEVLEVKPDITAEMLRIAELCDKQATDGKNWAEVLQLSNADFDIKSGSAGFGFNDMKSGIKKEVYYELVKQGLVVSAIPVGNISVANIDLRVVASWGAFDKQEILTQLKSTSQIKIDDFNEKNADIVNFLTTKESEIENISTEVDKITDKETKKKIIYWYLDNVDVTKTKFRKFLEKHTDILTEIKAEIKK